MAGLSQTGFVVSPSGDVDATTTEVELLRKEMQKMQRKNEDMQNEMRAMREETDERLKKVEDPWHQAKAVMLAETFAHETRDLIFMGIEELYETLKARIIEEKEETESEALLKVLDEWRKDAKARRKMKILYASAGAGVSAGVTAAVVTAVIGGACAPILASFAIAGIGTFLLVAGGLWLFTEVKEWSGGNKKDQ